MLRTILLLLASCLPPACTSRVAYQQPDAPRRPDAINVNTASVDELERLPHIGRQTAEAIVEFRSVNGPFRRIEHLMLIRGISERRLVELRSILHADQTAE